MRVLFLTQILPYPPDAGPRVKTWNVIRHLRRQGHELVLVTFVRSSERPHMAAVRELCSELHAVPLRRARYKDVWSWLRSLVSGRPFLVERDDHPRMRELVRSIVAGGAIDVVHIDQLTMAQFAIPGLESLGLGRVNGDGIETAPWPVTVFDAHNAVWTIVERMRRTASPLLRPVLALEARRLKQYEGRVVRASDHALAVSDQDKAALLQAVAASTAEDRSDAVVEAAAARTVVIPIAVDTESLQPMSRAPRSKNILTLGTLHYPPNADGIRWFLQEVYPRIRAAEPGSSLTIVGKNPPADLVKLAQRYPGEVKVTGYVPELRPYLEAAAVLVVPVRSGGGMRVRILEAFAWGMPIVTTGVGLEGILAEPGEHLMVADEPAEFAERVVDLMRDEDLQSLLAARGRSLVESRYEWREALGRLDLIYANGADLA